MISSLAVAAAVHLDVDLTYIHSHFLQLAVASFLLSTVLSIYLYVRSRQTAPTERALGGNSGESGRGANKMVCPLFFGHFLDWLDFDSHLIK